MGFASWKKGAIGFIGLLGFIEFIELQKLISQKDG